MGSHAYTIYLAEVQGGANLFAWSLVMILSSVPMCLSSVYKERALGEAELNPIYLNGWIAIFQFILAIPLSLPAAYVGEPQISPRDLARNILDGFKCYLGQDSIMDGPNPDHCEMATLYVTIYLLFNVTYNVLIILILKYGSANILWLVRTFWIHSTEIDSNGSIGNDDYGSSGQCSFYFSFYARSSTVEGDRCPGSLCHHVWTNHLSILEYDRYRRSEKTSARLPGQYVYEISPVVWWRWCWSWGLKRVSSWKALG